MRPSRPPSSTQRPSDRGERGAALVEFALVFPLFMFLILGTFSGAQAYDHNLSLTHAAREGARYAATLAKDPTGPGASAWLSAVVDRTVKTSASDINLSQPGHFVCVALLKANGSIATDSAGNLYFQWLPSQPPTEPDSCYVGTAPYARVHVLVKRPDSIDTVLYSHGLTLTSRATARYEPPV